MAPGLGWKRFDHFSVAVEDADKAAAFYRRLFGLAEAGAASAPVGGAAGGFRGALLDMPNGQGQIEILEPVGEQSFLRKFLQTRGPGVHHIAIEVEDVEAAAAYLREELGIEPFPGIVFDHQWKHLFIHPRDSGGVLYQLFEWLPGARPSERA